MQKGMCSGRETESNIEGEGWEMNHKEVTGLTNLTQGIHNTTGSKTWMSQPDSNNTLPHGTVTWKRVGTAFAICRWSTYLAGNHLHQKSYCVLTPSVLYNEIPSEIFWHKSSTFHMVLSEFVYNEKQSSYYHLEHSRFIKAIYICIYMDFFFDVSRTFYYRFRKLIIYLQNG